MANNANVSASKREATENVQGFLMFWSIFLTSMVVSTCDPKVFHGHHSCINDPSRVPRAAGWTQSQTRAAWACLER